MKRSSRPESLLIRVEDLRHTAGGKAPGQAVPGREPVRSTPPEKRKERRGGPRPTVVDRKTSHEKGPGNGRAPSNPRPCLAPPPSRPPSRIGGGEKQGSIPERTRVPRRGGTDTPEATQNLPVRKQARNLLPGEKRHLALFAVFCGNQPSVLEKGTLALEAASVPFRG